MLKLDPNRKAWKKLSLRKLNIYKGELETKQISSSHCNQGSEMEIIKTFWICRDLEVSSVVNAIQLLIYLPDPEDEGGRVGEEGRVSHDVHSQ